MAKHLAYLDRAITDTLTGTVKRLLVTMPPRHGKSELCSKYLPAWFLGTFPDKQIILTSYEAEFAAEWGRASRDVIEEHGHLFGVKIRNDSSAANRWQIVGRTGGMRTAGVDGPVTGKGADLLIIDDPIKSDKEARSETIRESAWTWYLSTAYTRLSPTGVVILIQTRWHEDDLAGRVLLNAQQEGSEPWRIVNFPAIAIENDCLGRKPGEALWPQRWPIESLENIRRVQLGRSYLFNALYQQNPIPPEGGMFKRQWLSQFVDVAPADIRRAVRGWDKAGTSNGGDYSAGILIAKHDDLFYVVDVKRGQWSSKVRNDLMNQTAELDTIEFPRGLSIWTEQEPGSGGKESAEFTLRLLAGFDVHAEPSTGDKETRARAFAAQCEAGNVRLVRGPWNAAFIDELCSFPNGKHDDQVDAACLAFNKLARPHKRFLVA